MIFLDTFCCSWFHWLQLKQQQNAHEADKSSWQSKHQKVAAKLDETLQQLSRGPAVKFVQLVAVICY